MAAETKSREYADFPAAVMPLNIVGGIFFGKTVIPGLF
jgi:hypothetical protein